MSAKNYMAYGDAETILTEFANKLQFTQIERSAWNSMSDAQKEAYISTHPLFQINGSEATDGNIKVNLMTKLWENENPTTPVGQMNILLGTVDYDFLLIFHSNFGKADIIKKLSNGSLLNGYISSNGVTLKRRMVSQLVASHVIFDEGGSATGSTTASSDNSACIPSAIYGIKLTQEVSVSAFLSESETNSFTIASNDWIANTGSDATEFPYVANVVTGLYPVDFTPSDLLILGAIPDDYPTSADETAIGLVDKWVKFTGTSIRLRATGLPLTSVTLRIRG